MHVEFPWDWQDVSLFIWFYGTMRKEMNDCFYKTKSVPICPKRFIEDDA